MIRLFISLLIILVAVPASAETVQVSAAETSDATRVILDFKSRPIWSMQRKGVGYRFQFSSISPIRFDLSQIYMSIGRSRVSDVRALGNSTLEIDLACQCALIPNEIGETSLLFEVVNTLAPMPDVQLDPPIMSAPDLGEEASDVFVVTKGNATDLPSPVQPGVIELPSKPKPITIDALGTRFEPSVGLDIRGRAAVNMMAHALARAASQGLVDANAESVTSHIDEASEALPLLPDRGNLSVSTGFDTALPSDLKEINPVPSGKACLSDQHIDVASWGEMDDPTRLGHLRTQSIAEDGRVTPEGAKALARYYIFLGFGSEARRTSSFMTPSLDLEVVLALADIMDRGSSNSDVLDSQVACAGAVALWALLASPLEPSDAPESTNDLLTAFSALPAHLRAHLGPLLSKRLHDLGLKEQARTAINAATRGGNRTEESKLARARLDLGGTHAPAARDTLTNLTNSTSRTAAGALLELLKDAEDRGMAPNPTWVEDAPTLVSALEGTEIAERLNLAGLKGLIALGRYDEFRNAISGESPGMTEQRRKMLGIAALISALRQGDDAQFLKTEIAFSDLFAPQELDARTRIELADRLVEIGLADRAHNYVFDDPKTREELRITARVLIHRGENQAALELVRRSNLKDSDDILAEAFVAADDDTAAIAAFKKAGDFDQARAAAIRTGLWDWVAENGDDEVALAADRLIEVEDELSSGDAGSNGALIAVTRERRAKMLDLLSSTGSGLAGANFTN